MLNDSRETDKFGIPIDMFAYVKESHYAIIGRVAELGSMIDRRMLELLWALDDHTQSIFSDRYGKELEDLVRAAADSLADPKLRRGIRRMLNEAGRLRGRRNAIIHSLWPNPTDEYAFGHRPSAPAGEGQSPTKSIVTTRDELVIVVKEMVKIIDEIGALHAKAQPEKFARMTGGRLHLLPPEPTAT